MTAVAAKARKATIWMLELESLVIGDDFRLDENTEHLAELATSINHLGVLQPLVVRHRGSRYEVVAGRRRLAAARIARGLNQTQIAQRVGRSQTHVSMLLRVLGLPVGLRDKVHRREMSYVTAIDRWGRTRIRNSGGRGGHGALTGADAELASHWRRRHDRLRAGLYAVLKVDGVDLQHLRVLLDRLLKLDMEPFKEAS